ncbi:hypothetical protein URH17368_1317 [Alicyclobacillus hesperidum URH17-3-68]|nr:hypothetical protein URH17368_1317 [Alicyclobacillus hesperidum URH17-3-68]
MSKLKTSAINKTKIIKNTTIHRIMIETSTALPPQPSPFSQCK